MSNRMRVWQRGTLGVSYRHSLEGGGMVCAEPFAQFIRAHCDRRFEHAFEWCAGPGFIGFTLLAEGLCDRLCLADINPAAIDCVRQTIARNRLAGRASCYVSDNFASIPASARFDLVVGNPPSYCGLNPAHPSYAHYQGDLRVNDPGWRLRRDFYRNVGRHMNPGAWLFVMEVAVNAAEVRTPGFLEPYDVRPRPPLIDFREMIAELGLTLLGVEPLLVAPGGFPVDMLFARRAGG